MPGTVRIRPSLWFVASGLLSLAFLRLATGGRRYRGLLRRIYRGPTTMDSTNSSSDSGQGANEEPLGWSGSSSMGMRRVMFTNSPRSPRVKVEHDRETRVFRIVESNGRTAVFRDEPVRFLVVVRSPQTGETMPVMRYGEPEYLYLCREERQRG